MSATKALEIEDQHGGMLRFEKEDGGQIQVEVIGDSKTVELDETDRREVAEWLGLARG